MIACVPFMSSLRAWLHAAGYVASFLAGAFVGSARSGGEAASDLLGLAALVVAVANSRADGNVVSALDRQLTAALAVAFSGSALAHAFAHEAVLGAAVLEAAAKMALSAALAYVWEQTGSARQRRLVSIRQAGNAAEARRSASIVPVVFCELLPAVGCGLLWLVLRKATAGGAGSAAVASFCATVRVFGVVAAVLGPVRGVAAVRDWAAARTAPRPRSPPLQLPSLTARVARLAQSSPPTTPSSPPS